MTHKNIVQFKVYGDYALFSDPITRPSGEKFSYQIPTYEALKGILMSVYWKPTIIWYIDKVRIMRQIQTECRGVRPIRFGGGSNELSYYTYLKDVEYQVQAHFEWNLNRPELAKDRNENKHHNIAKRMIEKGGRRDVFLGTRECQGYVEPCVFGSGTGVYDNVAELDFGFMYHGITYADEAYSDLTKGRITKRFWQPVMREGVIEFLIPTKENEEKFKNIYLHKTTIKEFGIDKKNFVGVKEFDKCFDGDDLKCDNCVLIGTSEYRKEGVRL